MPQGLRMPLNRRRMLQASGAAGLALGSGLRLGSGAGAQEITFSRDYEGTTLRDHYDLPIPENGYASKKAAA